MNTALKLKGPRAADRPSAEGTAEPARAYRVLLVTPRVVSERPSTGREKLLRGLVEQGPEFGAIDTVTIPGVFSGPGSAGKLAMAALHLAWDTLRGRPSSLQSLLFRTRAGAAVLAEAVARYKPDILYFDSVRLLHLAPRGAERPCVVVDLDDLLSRRIHTYARAGIRHGAGELGRSIPRLIVALVQQPLISRIYLAVEKWATRRAELRAAREADALVLTSPAEARALRRFVRRFASFEPVVMSHPLAVALKAPIPRGVPQRLTFVGTALLPQNQDGILWCHKAAGEPGVTVEVYGSGERAPVEGEPRYFGYVEDLASVYGPDAMPTCMTRVRGGIKTKVLEAWSYGAPILVTPQGLEGVDVKGYPLVAAWDTPVSDVMAMLTPQAIETAVNIGRAYLRDVYAADSVAPRWREVFQRATETRERQKG